MVSDDEADKLLEMVKSSGLTLFYVRLPADYGIINGKAS